MLGAAAKPTPEKPYEQLRVPVEAAVARKFTATKLNDEWRFAGDCPRCGHHWEKVVREEVMVMAFKADVPAAADEGVHVVQCNCTRPHPGRPAEASGGCGAYWGIRVRRVEQG